MNHFGLEAYWGGLTHFEIGYTEDLKELVTKTEYYSIFRNAARALAPDQVSLMVLEHLLVKLEETSRPVGKT